MSSRYTADGKRRSSQTHAQRSWTCRCGRTVWGNGGKASHQRACEQWLRAESRRLAEPYPADLLARLGPESAAAILARRDDEAEKVGYRLAMAVARDRGGEHASRVAFVVREALAAVPADDTTDEK